VRGVDFQYTGDVVYVDVDAVARRLRFGDVVLLSSLGFNAAGEVLNCQSYDVAVSLAVDVAADKLISYVAPGDMPVGEDGARAKYMPLSAAEAYISRKKRRLLCPSSGAGSTARATTRCAARWRRKARRDATAETETETTETLSLLRGVVWRRRVCVGAWTGVRRRSPRLCFRARRACAART
jgi:hypothetical protein